MAAGNDFDPELVRGLKALAETTFPKRCRCCNRVFNDVADYVMQTEAMPNGRNGLKQSMDDDGKVIVDLFRNCPCGSTLMDSFGDRRDAERRVLEEFGVEESEVQQVLLAGSFGSYLSPASAVKIGLVPKLPVMRIVSAGNVAGEGAKMVLLSAQERNGAMALLDEIDYIELSDRADFNDKFVERLSFPA